MTDTAVNARPFGIRDKIGYALGMLVFPFKYTEAGASVDVLSIVIWTVLLMIANVGNGAVIPQEAKESVSDEIFEMTAANTDNTDIINTDTENPDNDRDT